MTGESRVARAGADARSAATTSSTPAASGARLWTLPFVGYEVPVMRLYVALSLVVFNICDVVLTKAVLHNGGAEGNPLMKDLMAGYAAPLGVKAAAAALAGLLLMMCPVQSRVADRAAVTVAGLYFAVVVWNSALLGYLLTHPV